MPRFPLFACLGIAMSTAPALAQNAPIYATKADIAAATAKAEASIQPGHGSFGQPLVVLGNYTAKLEYHVGPNIAAAHDQQAEMFHALEGSGTLITGGTVVKTATSAIITGGVARHIAAGDVFIIPEGTPHWFSQVDGHMVLISIMLPRPKDVPVK
jgi:mannose-6-phosphate isomerase-like protein (cupin superfamily)